VTVPYRRLYVFVEGTDDGRFFDKVVKPRLGYAYDHIDIVRYAQDSPKKRRSFLQSIRAIEGAEIIWVCDNDSAQCVTARKQEIKNRLPAIADNPIVVVVIEIESWYLAGVDTESSRSLGIRYLTTTDSITKENFGNLRPSRIETNREFMLAILDHFSVETAQNKNRSFRYFYQKYLSKDVLVT
jgi:hypothetical protein